MKILYIALGNLSDPTMGGSLIRTLATANCLAQSQSVALLTTTAGKVIARSRLKNVKIILINTRLYQENSLFIYIWRQLQALFWVFIKVPGIVGKIGRFDIVYLDSDGIWDVYAAVWLKWRGNRAKIISMNHHLITLSKSSFGVFIVTLINKVMQEICHRMISIVADGIFVLQTDMGGLIEQKYRKLNGKLNIFRVNNGIDLHRLKNKLRNKTKYEAVFLGYLRPSKGLYDIIKIWKRVCQIKPKAKLLILGDMLPPYREYINREISQYKLKNNIDMTGYITKDQDVVNKLRSAKVFISASHEEGWGISIMEGMACGLPAVLWDLPVFNNLFSQGVVKIKNFSIRKFAETIVQLLNNSSQRKRLGQQAQNSVAKYDWPIVSKLDLEYFKIALSKT